MIASGRTGGAREINWVVDSDRLRNVVLKLARGHAAFEQSLRFRYEPSHYAAIPLHLLTPAQRSAFEAPDIPKLWGEVGSRSMQRAAVIQLKLRAEDGTVSTVGFSLNDWVEVQPERYSYLTTATSDGVMVRMIVGGFLACEVSWADNG